MMIVDAIRSASSEHAVHFLVTAYIESLRHYERSCGVPAEVLHLPVAGREELERRARVLRAHTPTLEAVVAVAELATVLASAAEQLAIVAGEPAAIMPRARSDNPRSALSV